jgi:hypothetical protein
MPSLGRSLQEFDLGHLRIIAELWGLDLPPGRAAEAAPELARRMLEPGLAIEIAQSLPGPSRAALDGLLANAGRQPIGELALRFGPMRRVGPGRRDREEPWRDPQAALDGLWYRGFISLAFFETPSAPEEFAYVPDELLEALRPLTPSVPQLLASARPPAMVHSAGGAADDAVTLLAALRRKPARSQGDPSRPAGLHPRVVAALQRHLVHPPSLELLLAALRGLGVLLTDPLRPEPARVRELLAAGRAEIEAQLLQEWRSTRRYNDLAATPGLAAPKGRWPNDPAVTRASALARIAAWGVGEWLELEAAVDDVRRSHPAFLRPGGDFESWMLQDASDGRLLRGVDDWDRVEGSYLRHLILGPLYWLGAADHGLDGGSTFPTHFRLRFDPAYGAPTEVAPKAESPEPSRVYPDGRVLVPQSASPAHRYQVARLTDWTGRDASGFWYRLTPRSLAAAVSQGLDASRVERVLETACGRPLPPALHQAIDRWAKRGTEAVLESSFVLRVKEAETLRQLRSDPATGRYLEEVLGPTAARIRSRDREALLAAAARRGLLIQFKEE